MKRIAAALIAASLLLSMSACQKKELSVNDTVSNRGPVTGIAIDQDNLHDAASALNADASGEETEESEPEDSTPKKPKPVAPKKVESEEETDSVESKPSDNKDNESKEESSKDESSKDESSKDESSTPKETTGGTSDEVAADGSFYYEDVFIQLPAGYYIQSNSNNIITTVPGDYPYTNQNITFTMAAGKSAHITQEDVDTMYSSAYEGYSGCKEFIDYTIDGYDAQYYSFDISISGLTLNMAQLAVYLDNKSVIFTFTSEQSEDFSVLKKSADSVRVP